MLCRGAAPRGAICGEHGRARGPPSLRRLGERYGQGTDRGPMKIGTGPKITFQKSVRGRAGEPPLIAAKRGAWTYLS